MMVNLSSSKSTVTMKLYVVVRPDSKERISIVQETLKEIGCPDMKIDKCLIWHTGSWLVIFLVEEVAGRRFVEFLGSADPEVIANLFEAGVEDMFVLPLEDYSGFSLLLDCRLPLADPSVPSSPIIV